MNEHFYGTYHWVFSPVIDRPKVLSALEVFCNTDANLFVEAINPSLKTRFRYFLMRSNYRTNVYSDALLPSSKKFHLKLSSKTLQKLKLHAEQHGFGDEIAHIKGYQGEKGLFWFHGFSNPVDDKFCCSKHVTEEEIASLEKSLGVKAEQVHGELKSPREWREYMSKMIAAFENYTPNE